MSEQTTFRAGGISGRLQSALDSFVQTCIESATVGAQYREVQPVAIVTRNQESGEWMKAKADEALPESLRPFVRIEVRVV